MPVRSELEAQPDVQPGRQAFKIKLNPYGSTHLLRRYDWALLAPVYVYMVFNHLLRRYVDP